SPHSAWRVRRGRHPQRAGARGPRTQRVGRLTTSTPPGPARPRIPRLKKAPTVTEHNAIEPGSNVLVTGGAGYVGSVCTAVLVENGFTATAGVTLRTGNRPPTTRKPTSGEAAMPDVATKVLAVGDFAAVSPSAPRSLVGESVEQPDAYWHHNVVTTLTLLDAMREAGVKNIVFSSTAACYGEPEQVPITEDMPTAPTNPYGASKLTIDYMLSSYAKA